MAVGTALAIGGAIAGGALLGGAAGAQKKKQNSSSGLNLAEASALEQKASRVQNSQFSDLENILYSNPNQDRQDYQTGLNSQKDLARMLGEYSKSGGLPSQADINSANQVTGNLFAQRQTELDQVFQDQNTEAERLAARLGRPVNDPIIQAKLRTGFIRQQDLLNAEKQGASQNLALQLPNQRLGYAQNQATLLDAIGQRAIDNRNFLIGLGSNLAGSERNWRLQTAEQWGKQSSGGGLGGALSGMIGGAGAGMGMMGSWQQGQASMGLMNAQTNALNYRPAMSLPMPTMQIPQAQGYNMGNWGSQISNANPFATKSQFGFLN